MSWRMGERNREKWEYIEGFVILEIEYVEKRSSGSMDCIGLDSTWDLFERRAEKISLDWRVQCFSQEKGFSFVRILIEKLEKYDPMKFPEDLASS